jgi:CRP/FNR family transcriptional regulator
MTCANKECPFFVKPKGNGGTSAREAHCLVCDSVKQSRFSKGDIMFSQNEPSCCVYALTSGIVKLCDVSPSGDEQIVGFACPHKLMVGLRSLSKDTYSDSAIAETDVTACKIRKRALLAAVGRKPEIAIRLIDAINSQLSMSRELMRVTERHGAKAKIAAFLVLVVPQLNGGGTRVEFPFSRSEMAGLLSLSEETVCRQMADMRREGILYAPRGSIEIRDWDRLRAIADEAEVAAA